jgi:hypothetical protein
MEKPTKSRGVGVQQNQQLQQIGKMMTTHGIKGKPTM